MIPSLSLNTLATNLRMLGLKPEELSQVKSNIESLNHRDKELDQKIRDIDRDIHILQNQQIDKKGLYEIFSEFAGLYTEAPPEVKRRLLNVIIEEIRCVVKRGEKTGEIVYKLRGDGTVRKAWEEAKTKEESSGSGKPGLTPRVAWLRETHDKSNFLILRIPLEIYNSVRGEKVFSIAEAPLQSTLPISSAGITRLRECRLIQLPRTKPERNPPIDYDALATLYREMLHNGDFSSQAELACHLGVSRVWVSRVLKGIKKKAG